MIRRKERDAYFLISQDDHAALSGKLAEHIGNDRFAKPDPFDEVVMGISLHDAGWPAHDNKPTANSHQAPLHIFETPMSIALPAWAQSVAETLDEDPYTTLLVSLHVLSLSALAKTHTNGPHGGYDSPQDLFELNKFQHAQVEQQAKLREVLGLRTDVPLELGLAKSGIDPKEDQLIYNAGLMKLMDRLSLDVCCNEDLFQQIDGIYTKPGSEPISITVRHSADRMLIVDPWPFDAPELSFEVPFKRVPLRAYTNNEELQQLYAAAPNERMTVTLKAPWDAATLTHSLNTGSTLMPEQISTARSIWNAYANRHMAALLALGFASGLPFTLTGATLQSWMTDAKVDLKTIGLFSLVTWPYTIKFLWSPLMDRFVPPFLGRRRGWLLVTQLALVIAIAVMAGAGMEASQSVYLLVIASILVAFLSASQDIVVDAYRTDVLPEPERGAGAAIFVTGSKLAVLLATTGAFVAAGRYEISWPTIYLALAALMLLGIIATLLSPEPREVQPPLNLSDAVVEPFKAFLSRPGAVAALIFILLFRLPDSALEPMKIPYLQGHLGYSKEVIGWIGQGAGFFMVIVGALFGGGVVARLGLVPSLWVFGALQAFSNLGFWALLGLEPNVLALTVVIAIENFCSGLVTAGFVAFLMSQCDPKFSATQFALLSSLMAVSRVMGGPTGWIVEHAGWGTFFFLSVILSVPAFLVLPWIKPIETLLGDRGFEPAPLPSPNMEK